MLCGTVLAEVMWLLVGIRPLPLLQPYFNVTTAEVLARLRLVLWPLAKGTYWETFHYYPDMYSWSGVTGNGCYHTAVRVGMALCG